VFKILVKTVENSDVSRFVVVSRGDVNYAYSVGDSAAVRLLY